MKAKPALEQNPRRARQQAEDVAARCKRPKLYSPQHLQFCAACLPCKHSHVQPSSRATHCALGMSMFSKVGPTHLPEPPDFDRSWGQTWPQHRADSDRSRAKFARAGPSLARIRPRLGQVRTTLRRVLPNLGQSANQIWNDLDKSWGGFDQIWGDLDQIWVCFDRNRPNRPKLSQIGGDLDRSWTKFHRVPPNLARMATLRPPSCGNTCGALGPQSHSSCGSKRRPETKKGRTIYVACGPGSVSGKCLTSSPRRHGHESAGRRGWCR